MMVILPFRVSVYYYYVDGDYAENILLCYTKIHEFLVLAGDKEKRRIRNTAWYIFKNNNTLSSSILYGF